MVGPGGCSNVRFDRGKVPRRDVYCVESYCAVDIHCGNQHSVTCVQHMPAIACILFGTLFRLLRQCGSNVIMKAASLKGRAYWISDAGQRGAE